MQPKLVAISYMLNRNGYDAKFAQCHNIQQQDLAAYQREDQRCAKEEVMKTPILAIFERVQRMTLPLVAMHKVEKQMNKVCISKEKVKTCGGLMAGKGLGSGSMKEKLVKYACVSAPSAKAESLKKRAMGGEALDFELNELPISYTKMEKEPFYCGVKGGKLKAYQGCDMRNGVLGNPDCGSGERCVAVIGNAGVCHPANKYRSEGGAGGLGGGYGSEFGSGIEGGFMDAPGCEYAPTSECSDPKFRLRCPIRCSQRLGSDQQLTSNPKFFVEDKGSSLCGGGYAIMGANKCKEACNALNLPQMQIHGSNLCYKDNEGKCWQDGQEKWARNRYGVSLICEKVGLEGGAEGLEGGYGSESGSGVQGVEGGAGSKCDTRKGYDGNPACENGETCVPTIMNLGECRTVAVGAPGAKKCSTRQGELNNPKCFSTQKCIWSFHYQSGVCVFKSTQFQAAESEIKGLQLENGEKSLVGGYGSGAENGGNGMGGGYGSGAENGGNGMGGAYGSGLEGGSIGGSYGMGGGYRSDGGNGANGMEEGYGSGIMGGDFGYGVGKGAHGMGGYGGARHGMGGGYGGVSEGSNGRRLWLRNNG